MIKREKLNFTDLKDAFSEKPSRTYTEDELLSVFRNPETLVDMEKGEQILIFGAIARQMQSSEDFRRKVLEAVEKMPHKPPR